ncbi:MAG: hypothetical protein CR986_10340 [Ignavibacteriae bacterium]|nr:MAG: hypothetical protein CR986_10340 [Ignavibacteriota bacterium]
MRIKKIFLLLSLSVLFTFCGEKNDKEIFEEGNRLLAEEKYEEAVIKFGKLASKFKNSNLAPKALFETAKVYQGKVIKDMHVKESLLKSVKVYQQIFNEYPKSKEAENSLFMSGFILANELKDFDKAKKTYEKYLKIFPNGKLVNDAKIELANLGKTPEEILNEKMK